MPEKSVNTKKASKPVSVSILAVLALALVTLLVSRCFGSRRYYLCSVLMMIYAMVPFFLSFEKRRPQAREIVTLAVMCAIAVASRAAFIMLPHFKPMTGIIMITAISFGPEAGFLTGAISAFVSNFVFGQGPWTPWQMFAYGIAGFLAGILAGAGILNGEKRVKTAVFGGLAVLLVVGPILDTCALFLSAAEITKEAAVSIYLSGLPVNAVHALATFLTVLLLLKPVTEKLNRIRIKYGMMEDDDEI